MCRYMMKEDLTRYVDMCGKSRQNEDLQYYVMRGMTEGTPQ